MLYRVRPITWHQFGISSNCCQSERALRVHEPQICKLCKRSKSGCEVNTFHWPITNRYGNTFMLKSSFHIDYSATIFEDVYMKEPIERSSHEILISCSACHRIKDRVGNWVRADTEILDRYIGRISHGICSYRRKVLPCPYPWWFLPRERVRGFMKTIIIPSEMSSSPKIR